MNMIKHKVRHAQNSINNLNSKIDKLVEQAREVKGIFPEQFEKVNLQLQRTTRERNELEQHLRFLETLDGDLLKDSETGF